MIFHDAVISSEQVVHLDMAESDPDLDQDFPKMSIS